MLEIERGFARKKTINLTPLIDIIFQLVIFFMLSTTFVKIEAVDVFVEKRAEEKEKPKEIKNLTPMQKLYRKDSNGPIEVQLLENRILVNGEVAELSSLKTVMLDELRQGAKRDTKVFVQKGVSVQQMVDVLDNIKSAGAASISINKIIEE